HGSAGALQLGAATLDAQALLQRAGELAGWSQALAPGADLLLYGCDFAATDAGRAMVQGLAALTGADVAASTNATGSATAGADWRLEYRSGAIDTGVAASLAAQARWQGTLATYTVTSTADAPSANAPAGTLRWAIQQANDNPGGDTIVFAIDGVFAMAAGAKGDDSASNGDLDIAGNLTLVGRGVHNTVIEGNGEDRVFDVRSGTVVMQDLTVRGGGGNGDGVGLRVRPAGDLTLQRVVVSDHAGKANGAGIYNEGDLTLRNTELRDNTASGHKGGGLYNRGTATLVASTVAGNGATDGGGIYTTGELTATSSTFSDNSASGKGGALYATGNVLLDHVTIAFNSAGGADRGGGVYFGGDDDDDGVRVGNSIVVQNTGGDLRGGFSSRGFNMFSDSRAGGMYLSDRASTTPAQAGLAPLGDNGGGTRTHALLSTSLARDAASTGSTVATDQRGLARAGRADIGAYEFIPSNSAPTIAPVADKSTPEDVPLAFAFTIGDAETAAALLTVTASSSNAALVRASDLVLGGSGANRTLTIRPQANASGTATITLAVSDGSGSTLTTFLLTVGPVNDAPVAVGDVATTPAGQTVRVDVLANDRDVEGHALTLVAASVNSAHGVASVVGNQVEFTPNAGVTGLVEVRYTLRDALGADAADVGILQVSVGANAPPASTAPATVALPEDGQAVITRDHLNYADADGHALAGLRIDALPGAGRLTLAGAEVRVGMLVSAAQLDAGELVYAAEADAHGTGYASLRFSVQDALGAYATTPGEVRFDVLAQNDAPVLGSHGSGAAGLDFIENAAPLPVFGTLGLQDVDSTTLASAQVRIGDGYRAGEDELLLAAGSADIGNITARFDAATGSLQLESAGGTATLAQWQAALRAVAYRNGSDTPDTGTRSISLQVNDGGASDAQSNVLRTLLTPQAVNDAPVVATVPLGPLMAGGTRLITAAELLAAASDADHDLLSAGQLVLSSGSGTLVHLGGGQWQFTADAGAHGALRFSFEVSDGQASVSGMAELTV
ncbi:MAG: tandem-95 repeat protein, partial [Aquincola tertiaricarbonis]